MKKIIATLLLISIALLSFASCGLIPKKNNADNNTPVQIRIGYMAGPTGMGMAKLISDNGGLENGNEKYVFTKYADTNAAKADLAAGNIDVICLPTNEAAVYFNTVDKGIKVLAINCLNSLYLLTDKNTGVSSLSDLEGQTIYTCKNGTPRTVLQYIINELGINATISYEIDGKEILTPADLSAQVVAGNLPNAVMPEPLVTSSLLSIAKNGNADIAYSVDVNLANEWAKISHTPLTMGCIVASSQFIGKNPEAIEAFLEEYKASVDYIGNPNNLESAANYVVETEVMAAAPAAKKALANLGNAIDYIDGKEMKDALIAFYNAIGVTLPEDDFYYE